MMCFRIKCKWVNHQTVLTLTGRDAEDTTVMSFSLDLLAIGKSLHGRCCKPQLADGRTKLMSVKKYSNIYIFKAIFKVN